MKLTVNYPNLPKGAEVQIGGIGNVKNGEEVELTDRQQVDFLAVHNKKVEDAFKGSKYVKVVGKTKQENVKAGEAATGDLPDTGDEQKEGES
jgi:ABC-type tungstate transport system permease subunit